MSAARDMRLAPPESLLTEQELANYLKVSVETVRDWRKPGREGGPVYKKIQRSVRYDMRDVQKFLERATIDPENPKRR
jgi:hypothetical protein